MKEEPGTVATETERRQRMADAYRKNPAGDRRRSREARVGATFRRDGRLEALLALREADRAAFDALPPGVRMSASYYANAKAAHAATETEDGTDG